MRFTSVVLPALEFMLASKLKKSPHLSIYPVDFPCRVQFGGTNFNLVLDDGDAERMRI